MPNVWGLRQRNLFKFKPRVMKMKYRVCKMTTASLACNISAESTLTLQLSLRCNKHCVVNSCGHERISTFLSRTEHQNVDLSFGCQSIPGDNPGITTTDFNCNTGNVSSKVYFSPCTESGLCMQSASYSITFRSGGLGEHDLRSVDRLPETSIWQSLRSMACRPYH
jgi:hypothetical protein